MSSAVIHHGFDCATLDGDAGRIAALPAALDRRENLPGLLARAGQRLLDARNAAEVLEAKKLAETALYRCKVLGAARETQADCLRIIARAEMRMATEIDAAQERGEVHRHGKVQTSDLKPATYEELGIDKRRVTGWRQVRDAGEEIVEEAIAHALSEERAPTKAEIQRHAHLSSRRALPRRRRQRPTAHSSEAATRNEQRHWEREARLAELDELAEHLGDDRVDRLLELLQVDVTLIWDLRDRLAARRAEARL